MPITQVLNKVYCFMKFLKNRNELSDRPMLHLTRIDGGFVAAGWYRMKYAKREFASPAGQVFSIV